MEISVRGRLGVGRRALYLLATVVPVTVWSGPAEAARPAAFHVPLSSYAAAPSAIAAADFDGDGRRDLVVALASGAGSRLLTWSAAAEDRLPANGGHLPGELLFERDLPVRADFLAAGDFDADGRPDVAFAELGGDLLYWLRGDGSGRLDELRWVHVDGTFTAGASGEVNRRDGLEDLVIAVTGGAGDRLLIFEGPGGALHQPPEVHPLPATATAVALGQLDDTPWRETAVAVGSEVLVLAGRDRRLSASPAARAAVPAATWERLEVAAPVTGLAIEDLAPDVLGRSELLVTTARGSLVLQRAVEQTAAPRGAAAAAIVAGAIPSERAESMAPRRLARGESRRRTAEATTRASSAHPAWREVLDGRGPARAAAAARSELAGAGVRGEVRLDVAGNRRLVATADGILRIAAPAAATFVVNSTNDVNDGACNGTHCSLREAINAANATADHDTIDFAIAGAGPHSIALLSALPAITEPVTINGYSQSGAAENSDPVEFDGTIQLVLDGTSAGSVSALVFDGDATGSVVRGLAINDFAFDGIRVFSGGVTIEGNLIGLEPDGSTVAGLGGVGVTLYSDGSTVGGTTAAARNVISGPQIYAIGIDSFFGSAANNVVQGNLVGTDTSGTTGLGQTSFTGIMVSNANDNTIGGATAGAGNVVAASGEGGICFCNFDATSPLATGNVAQGNRVGTNASGSAALPNGFSGIFSHQASGNTIGGTSSTAGNLVSGNAHTGIYLSNSGLLPTDDNVVQGNYVGTDLTGSAAIPNGSSGILLFQNASSNTIGGASAAASNLVSGNTFDGIALIAAGGTVTGNLVQGNLVGTNLTGTLPLGNGDDGISLVDAVGNEVRGNTVRFNPWGVWVASDQAAATDNQVVANVITDNAFEGIVVFGNSSVRNRLSENLLAGNGALGIDLISDVGPNVNDPGDLDVGPNDLQNHPLFDAAPPGATSLSGKLASTPLETFVVELFEVASCDPSGFGEAEFYLGSVNVNTDASGNGPFTLPIGGTVAEGDTFTATATDADGNTSELSQCRESCVDPVDLPPQTVSGAQTETACETLSAGDGGFDVDGTGDLTLRAGARVVLESGFSVLTGGELTVRIEPRLAPP